MENKIARTISYLFHPLLIPLYILVLLLSMDRFASLLLPFGYKISLLAMVALLTVVMPLLLTWLLVRVRFISNLFMESREERIYPVLAIAVFYYGTYYLLREVRVSAIFSFYMLSATLLAILSLLLNFWRKISLHLVAMGSFTGLFIGLSLNFGVNFLPEITGGILLSGIIAFSRLQLQAHKPGEVYAGFAMGLTVTAVMMLLI